MAEREKPEASRSKEKPLYGILLFLTDESGYFLALTNLKTDRRTRKVPGQLTAPAERREPNESFLNDMIPRTIREEVGVIKDDTSRAHFRGIIIFTTESEQIVLVGYEKQVKRESVRFEPEDTQEVGDPQWILLENVGNQTIQIGSYRISLFRDPIPEFVNNILKVRHGQKFPIVKKVESSIPLEIFDFIEKQI
ncbi:hypothetical protein A3F02_00270 [Candidatus Curtissbacteria bacterium RIFCSPHIGHO2_12_FULL_38_9b]|uniref:Nudix hydrolase domain-containing protein n=2 Tax=Candidatus Curtissiibacteriota TaxID=1752717 RepID=A0A1F5GYF5_9BACT|nr:MAG: hypothetical protein A3A48_00850 [Candidatus Curtissbacteria bacterium RIFCSPLOWO2_01_FULL_37_9]OGD96807.1 MAG: hypothetical protein A3F02_00270 [Candidatus Curtissbacteria bacterium RIFCSPHIGHO2_12_FULL_38_9b]